MLGRAIDSALTEAWFCGFQEGAFSMWEAGVEKMNAQRLNMGRTGSGCMTEGHQQSQSPPTPHSRVPTGRKGPPLAPGSNHHNSIR